MQTNIDICFKNRGIFFAALCLFFSSKLLAQIPSETTLSVYLKEANTNLNYSKPTRLSQLLIDASKQLNFLPYRLSSALIAPSQQEAVNRKKQAILSALNKLNSLESQRLYKQLNRLSFAPKLSINLDLDRVQLSPEKNPLLSGKYELSLPPRPNHIIIIEGSQTAPIYAQIRTGSSLRDYLQTIRVSSDSDNDYPWVIQADQTSYQASNVYWKGNKTFLSPGAIIFIGLGNLPAELQALNQQIAQLLAYHVEK